MSEYDPVADRVIFEQIVESNSVIDAGIASFDLNLKETEAQLRELYIGRGRADISEDELAEIEGNLEAYWPYFDDIATVSGRIELASDEDDETLQALLGDVLVPDEYGDVIYRKDNGDPYCYVQNAKLESEGIIADPVRDEDGILRDISLMYEFALPFDGGRDALPIFARPGELSHHTYATPTPSEARVRLEYAWPDKLTIIDQLVRADGEQSLPQRLSMMHSQLGEALQDSVFRRLVELYVNDELSLNQKLPYMAVVDTEIDVLGDIEDDSSTWQSLRIEGGLTTLLYAPDVRFMRAGSDDATETGVWMYAQTFNDADGDKPEMVAVDVRHVKGFRSLWASDSLASRALKAVDDSSLVDAITQAMDDTSEVSFADTDTAASSMPEYIERLEEVESLLKTIRGDVVESQGKTYISHEAAAKESHAMCLKFQSLLAGTIADQGIDVEVMGQVIRSKMNRTMIVGDDGGIEQVQYDFDSQRSVSFLEAGESAAGYMGGLSPLTKSRENEAGVIVFSPVPHLVVKVPDISVEGDRVSETLLNQLIERRTIAVPLDDTADISVTHLERARTAQQAFDAAMKAYGDSPLMRRISEIDRVVYGEDPKAFTELKASRLSGFPKDLASQVGQQKAVAPALASLESMLGERNIICCSDVFKREDGRYAYDEDYSGKQVNWYTLDIKASDDGHEVMMFVSSFHNPDVYRYISLSSITSFRF